ncbi:flagellar biosynthesis protein FlhA [Radicibacter daui]|uniref:flagellar biosynthesis protein FlhA n=1 Tax=Radicibacter daui TaxID=3064829 RepID=UPI004046DEA1
MSDQSQAGFVGRLPPQLQQLVKAVSRGEVGFAVGVILLLVVLIFPMPAFLLDIGLSVSFTFSALVLLVVLFIEKPTDFTSFPSILLVSTMLRLALNLASTRLILQYGHEGADAAGHVIEAFAGFIMGGNFVIGVIVFAILVLVNFMVITKGSGRIAEVSARFTLDAMPGKQMAIDADLSSGLINEDQARDRRKDLQAESMFFGSMDGAAKFVRGDAVAGLIITAINVIGGIIIGVAMMDLSFMEAAQNYTRLTIGDGLVSQIPSLLVSLASGLLVTKGGTEGTADEAIFGQLSSYPSALGMAALLTALMSVLPGIPMIPFLSMSAITGGIAWWLVKRAKAEEEGGGAAAGGKAAGGKGGGAAGAPGAAGAAAGAPAAPAEEPISSALHIDQIRLELGYALLALVNNQQGQRLTDQIKGLRRQLAMEMGFIMPSVRIQDNLQLQPNEYMVRVKEISAGVGSIRPNMLLVMDPRGDQITIPGEATVEPTFGLQAMWVDPIHREEALFKGYTVVDAPTVVTTHITEIVKENMADLLSYAETQKLLDEVPEAFQKLVADVIPTLITMGGLQRVLQNLLSERVSIRDLPAILEGIAEATGVTRNVTAITEHVRSRLARQISDANKSDAGYIPLLTLSPDWEQEFANAIVGEGDDRQLSMAPSRLQQFITGVRQSFERQAMAGEMPVLLTSPGIRPYVRSIIERFRPQTVVMSQNEIHPKAKIKTLGQV